MQQIKQVWDNYKASKIIWAMIALVIIVGIVILVKNKDASPATGITTVTTGNVVDSVVLSGRTQSASEVDLGFAGQGRVNRVLVKEGDKVSQGQLLASIDTSDLYSSDVAKITREQDALVANAYRNLISGNLGAVSDDLNARETSPTITGVYSGDEGDYRIRVYGSNAASGASFEVSGLENGFNQPVAPGISVPLGSRGLYIEFPPGFSYIRTNWTVSIPNKRATTYATYLNAYESAKATRERVINDARLTADSVSSQMAKRRIYAPFAGTIAKVGVKQGEAVGSTISSDANQTGMITLISQNDYEVVLKVPEISVAKLTVGMSADIRLDAYGKDVVFPGKITSINPAETIVDGVPVYETKVSFAKADDRIRSGMTATATIIAQQKNNVVTIPASYIHTDSSGSYVYVIVTDDKTEKRLITPGLRGSDSRVEVVKGLSEGERVNPEAL
ncbi:MAG: efflux RND transporter periplasmic adaptor subunit [bacterium]